MGILDIANLGCASGGVHSERGLVVAERCFLAESVLARTVGLLGTRRLDRGSGLLIPRCRSVHTMGMRFPIACVWLGPGGLVLRVDAFLRPGRLARCPGAIAALEVLPERGRTVRAGTRLCGGSGSLRAVLGRDSREKCAICEESVAREGERAPRLPPLVGDGHSGPDR